MPLETVTRILESATKLGAGTLAQTCEEYKMRNIDIAESAMSGESGIRGGSRFLLLRRASLFPIANYCDHRFIARRAPPSYR